MEQNLLRKCNDFFSKVIFLLMKTQKSVTPGSCPEARALTVSVLVQPRRIMLKEKAATRPQQTAILRHPLYKMFKKMSGGTGKNGDADGV